MKVISAFLIGAIFLSAACNPCDWRDCGPATYYTRLRLVSAINGDDLVFGPSKKYDKDQISFFSVQGSDTSFFDSELTLNEYRGDSIFLVTFLPLSNQAFMKLSDGDIDTLNFTYDEVRTKCCGKLTEMTQLKFNNRETIPVHTEPLKLEK